MNAHPSDKAKNAGISLRPSLVVRAKTHGAVRFSGSMSAYVTALIEHDLDVVEPRRKAILQKLSPEDRALLFPVSPQEAV